MGREVGMGFGIWVGVNRGCKSERPLGFRAVGNHPLSNTACQTACAFPRPPPGRSPFVSQSTSSAGATSAASTPGCGSTQASPWMQHSPLRGSWWTQGFGTEGLDQSCGVGARRGGLGAHPHNRPTRAPPRAPLPTPPSPQSPLGSCRVAVEQLLGSRHVVQLGGDRRAQHVPQHHAACTVARCQPGGLRMCCWGWVGCRALGLSFGVVGLWRGPAAR